MFIASKSLVRRSTSIHHSYRHQGVSSPLSSILFPEPKPIDKPEAPPAPTPPVKPSPKQQAQAVVSSAADAAVNVLGVGWGALSAVSNRITGLNSSARKASIESDLLQADERGFTAEKLEQRTKSLIRSVKLASSTLSQANRIEELSRCLLEHPDANYFTKKV